MQKRIIACFSSFLLCATASKTIATILPIPSPLITVCDPSNGYGHFSQGANTGSHVGRQRYAMDFSMPIGTPLYSVTDGKVSGLKDIYPDTGGGADRMMQFNYLLVQKDSGIKFAYAHLQQWFAEKVHIKEGDRVQKGQLIGYSGNSGYSNGPHLHLETQGFSGPLEFSDTVPFAVKNFCAK